MMLVRSAQHKVPKTYSEEEKYVFGSDKGQHTYGTKPLAHIINEPVTVITTYEIIA